MNVEIRNTSGLDLLMQTVIVPDVDVHIVQICILTPDQLQRLSRNESIADLPSASEFHCDINGEWYPLKCASNSTPDRSI